MWYLCALYVSHKCHVNYVAVTPTIDIPSELNITPNSSTIRLPTNNVSQTEGIKKALTQSFTLVQGPPGKFSLSVHMEVTMSMMLMCRAAVALFDICVIAISAKNAHVCGVDGFLAWLLSNQVTAN